MIAVRPLVSLLACCTLAACATQTIESGGSRSVRTSVGSAPPTTAGPQSLHGYTEGELIIRFTPEGERTIAPWVAAKPGRLRFGIPSLDRLNAKYHANQLLKVADIQGGYLLRIAPDANVFRAVEEYSHDPMVTGADLNYLYRLPAPQAPNAVRTQVGPLDKNRPANPPP